VGIDEEEQHGKYRDLHRKNLSNQEMKRLQEEKENEALID